MGLLSKVPLGREVLSRASLQPLCLIAVLLGFAYILTRSLYLLWFHPLSEIPGPVVARLTTWWQSYHASRLNKAAQIQGW